MLATDLTPPPERNIVFAHFDIARIPSVSGCYALATFDRRVVYVGQTRDLNQRIRQHLEDNAKQAKTPWGVAHRIYYRECVVLELSDLESAWVDQFRLANRGKLPHFNKVEPPRS